MRGRHAAARCGPRTQQNSQTPRPAHAQGAIAPANKRKPGPADARRGGPSTPCGAATPLHAAGPEGSETPNPCVQHMRIVLMHDFTMKWARFRPRLSPSGPLVGGAPSLRSHDTVKPRQPKCFQCKHMLLNTGDHAAGSHQSVPKASTIGLMHRPSSLRTHQEGHLVTVRHLQVVICMF